MMHNAAAVGEQQRFEGGEFKEKIFLEGRTTAMFLSRFMND